MCSRVQAAFFDVGVFNPNAARYAKLELSKSYEINEKEKTKYYNERITQIEHGSFTPLVTSARSGMNRECRKFYVCLSEVISENVTSIIVRSQHVLEGK